MAWLRAISCACLLNRALVVGRALDLGDSISVVQGRLHAHAPADAPAAAHAPSGAEAPVGAASCLAAVGQEVEDRLDPALASQVQLVVVRQAAEDVRWLDALSDIPTVLYSHSGLAEHLPRPRANLRVETRPTGGVQGESFIRHIADNYDRLANLTVFLHGWPFWHCGGTLELVRRAVKNAQNPVDPDMVDNGALPGLVPLSASFDQHSLGDGLLGLWRMLNVAEHAQHQMTTQEAIAAAIRSYNATCREVLGRPCPIRHWVAEGSQWVVSSERIRSRPSSFYQRLAALNVPGTKIHVTRLKGLVLEALWPIIWGSPDWKPGEATKKAKDGLSAGALRRADALGNYCIFSTDRSNTPSLSERLGVCELERHRAGTPGTSVSLAADGRFAQMVSLRPVHDHVITKQMVKNGSKSVQASPPKNKERALLCGKRHIWPIATVTRVRNKETGACIERTGQGFALGSCKDKMVDSQQLHFIHKDNGGYFQILDKTESVCLAHRFPGGNKCQFGTDGGTIREQKWDLVRQSSGDYLIKMSEAPPCLIHVSGRLYTGECDGVGALWNLPDAGSMGQYFKRFDFGLTQMQDGHLKMRCAPLLHSNTAEAQLDSIQPEWRKKGKVLDFQLVDGRDGTYYFSQRTGSGKDSKEWFLNCNEASTAAVISEMKSKWKIHPVSDGLVFLESKRKVLQFVMQGGNVRCGALPADGVPPKDSTFAMEFLPQPLRPL